MLLHGPPIERRDPTSRLLLVAYHFPPALTAGALRWQKLIPLLADRGWAFDVLTLDPALIERPDWDRLRELPSTTRVFGVRPQRSLMERIDDALTPRRRPDADRTAPRATPPRTADGQENPESLSADEIEWAFNRDGLRRVYGTLLIHGRERAWARSAVEVGRALLEQGGGPYAAVISSGPPHGAHLGALRLARAARAPFVTDFRDPWSVPRRLSEAYASPLYFKLAAREERATLAASSLVIATTDPISDSLRSAGAPCSVITVMNGNDDEAFRSPPRERFVIAYAGALYLDRDPRPLFAAVAELIRKTGATPRELQVLLIGPVHQYAGRSTLSLAEEAGVAPYVRIEPSIPRRALADRLAEASVLVSFPQDSKFAVPSKLFEYMAFEAWLLVLSPPDTPSATMMAGTDAVVVDPGVDAVPRIATALERWFTAFRAGDRPTFLSQRDRFSRRTQAKILMDALEQFRGGAARR